MDSALPWTLDVGFGNDDEDAVTFQYAGQAWDSESGQCETGVNFDGATAAKYVVRCT